MFYPGDTVILVLPINKTDGTDPNVTTSPTVSILNAHTNAVVQINGQAAVPMSLVSGTFRVYTYPWFTGGVADGTYLAIVNYASDGITVQGRLLDTIVL